jgi:hypothetical protein
VSDFETEARKRKCSMDRTIDEPCEVRRRRYAHMKVIGHLKLAPFSVPNLELGDNPLSPNPSSVRERSVSSGHRQSIAGLIAYRKG